MIRLTTNKRLITGPTCWAEMTVEHFQNIMTAWDKKDDVMLKSLLYDIPYDELMNTKAIELIPALEQASSFWITEPLDDVVPDVLVIGGKTLIVPKAVGEYSVGQAILCRRSAEGKMFNQVLSKALAIYLQPEWSGKGLNNTDIDALEKIILTMPLPEVYGTACFLLQSVSKIWESNNKRMESVKIPGADKDDEIAEMSGVGLLTPLADLIIIDKFAKTYMLHPDDVCDKTSFDVVMDFMYTWKQQEAFQKRFEFTKKLLTPTS